MNPGVGVSSFENKRKNKPKEETSADEVGARSEWGRICVVDPGSAPVMMYCTQYSTVQYGVYSSSSLNWSLWGFIEREREVAPTDGLHGYGVPPRVDGRSF